MHHPLVDALHAFQFKTILSIPLSSSLFHLDALQVFYHLFLLLHRQSDVPFPGRGRARMHDVSAKNNGGLHVHVIHFLILCAF